MMPALRGRVSKLIFLNISDSVRHLYPAVPLLMRSHSFSSIDGGRPPSEVSGGTSNRPFARGTTQSADSAINNGDGIGDADGGGVNYRHRGRQDPPDPIPNRPLRGENSVSQPERRSQRNFDLGGKNFDDDHHSRAGGFGFEKSTAVNATRVGGNRTSRQSGGNLFKFGTDEGAEKNIKSFAGEKHGDFLEKFKLGFDKAEKPQPHSNEANPQLHKEGEEIKGDKAVRAPPSAPPQEADEIFKKMKETGLIPNAVAMLDGLCKDGLVQEAMKLFGLMREKGTIPEVVIYTAVVEGFCKAQKLEDAKRIFRKMQNNGISPNAFSYAVLIQGLYKGRKLEDALEFCVEMLEAGHSPNLATFAGLVDGFCREKGLEEARSIIVTLREKGYFFDEKAAREYLDKKGPFLPLVWEAILGKKSSQRSF